MIYNKITKNPAAFFLRKKITVSVMAFALVFSGAFAVITAQTSRAQASSLQQWECTADGLLFQVSQIRAIDLVTGEFNTFATLDDNINVNATGYNVRDGYIYGWSWTNSQLVRIGADGAWEPVSLSGTIPATTGKNTGDVDENGHYWLTGDAGVAGQTWTQIDLNTNTVVASGISQGGGVQGYRYGPDWAYVPGTDRLYRVVANSATDQAILLAFNRTTKQHEFVGNLGNLGGINQFGAAYADADGNLYASNNATGVIYRIDTETATASAFADGPPSANNDGAMCANAHVYTDYGDAPVEYGVNLANNGPRHHLRGYDESTNTADLMIGSQVSHEQEGKPSDDASADTFDDGIADPIYKFAGESTEVEIAVTNNTEEEAVLAGWIDLNGNGTFEPSERVTTTIPANSGLDDYTLTFPASSLSENTFARFRVFPAGVTNPLPTGTVGATAGEVEDHEVLAAQVTYTKTVSPDDTVALTPGETFTYTVAVENTGSVDLTDLSFTDDLSEVVDDAVYNDDIAADAGTATFNAPDEITWSGDLTAGQTATVTYTVTVNDPVSGDGVLVNGVVGSGPGSNCTDSPAVDPSCVTRVPQPDITTEKTLVGPSNPQAGDTVNYEITVTNNGGAEATGVFVADDLSGVLDDAAYNTDAAATSGSVTFNANTERLSWTGDLAANGDAGDTVTITYSVTVNEADALGDGILQNAILSADCPNPPITDPSDPSFDPGCATVTPIEAWMATKTASQTGNVTANSTVNYQILIENTGGADLTGLSVEDDLTGLLDDAVYNDDADATVGDVDFASPILSWGGDLASGDTSTITYSVTINDANNLGDAILGNVITGPMNCPGDACETSNPIAAWTLQKEATPSSDPLSAGDTIDYIVAVENTGSVDLTSALAPEFVDDMTDVLDDASYNNDASATIGTPVYSQPNLIWTNDLLVGEESLITYSVTVNDASADGNAVITNALIGGECPEPAITDPSNPEFNADCVTINLVSEWIATKSVAPGNALDPGEEVTYTVTVQNTGALDLTGAEAPSIEDDLTQVIDDATYNNDASATIGTPVYAEPVISWQNDLMVGETSTITYSATVNEAGDFNDGVLANAVTGAPNCPDPAVTNPDDPGYSADCTTVSYIASFQMTKTSDPEDGSNVEPGQTVNYTVTVENTGALDLTEFSFEDNLTNVLNNATLTGSPVVNPGNMGTATVGENVIAFDGDIPIGESVSVTYAVTVNGDAPADAQLLNFITGPFSNCYVGDDGLPTGDECLTTHTVTHGQSFLEDLAETGRNVLLPLLIGGSLIGTGVYAYRKWGMTALTK